MNDFNVAQPVWMQDDPHTYIIMGLGRGWYGSMMAAVVPEIDRDSMPKLVPVRRLSAEVPCMQPHPDKRGETFRTGTGTRVKGIDGGRRFAG